jgi:hypothetical protein
MPSSPTRISLQSESLGIALTDHIVVDLLNLVVLASIIAIILYFRAYEYKYYMMHRARGSDPWGSMRVSYTAITHKKIGARNKCFCVAARYPKYSYPYMIIRYVYYSVYSGMSTQFSRY